MTGAPIVTIVGALGGDPELRFTPSGAAVANFSVAVSDRRFDKQTDQWVDANTTWYRVSAWRQMAENVAESLERGSRVIVTGPLTNREYEKDGQKRYSLEITADDVGPALKWATAKVIRAQRSDGGGAKGAPADDPWASTGASTGGWPSGGQDSEPPF